MILTDQNLHHRLSQRNRNQARAMADAARAAGVHFNTFCETPTSYAIFAGVGSPLTQASGQFTEDDLAAITAFYAGHASSWEAIVDPFTPVEATNRLFQNGATVMNWEAVLVTEPTKTPANLKVEIMRVTEDQIPLWAEVARTGFFGPDPDPMMLQLDRVLALIPNTIRYLAYADGQPAGAATLSISEGIAFLGGAATLPEFRGRGIQTALIAQRLADSAAQAGLAFMGAEPGSGSHRNAERAGLQVAWTQLSLRVPAK